MTKRTIFATLAIVAVTVALTALLVWRSHMPSRPDHPVSVDTICLRNGDLVFRNGLSNESLLVTSVSNGAYSHVGLAYHNGHQWCVIHAVPGESQHGEPEYLKCEPIGVYLGVDRASAAAVGRVRCDSLTADRAATMALRKVAERVTFDNRYDETDTTCFYCTELVCHVYRAQGIDLASQRRTEVSFPGTTGKFIFPEHLWQDIEPLP